MSESDPTAPQPAPIVPIPDVSAEPPEPGTSGEWKARLPKGVIAAVDRAFDVADDMADGIKRAVDEGDEGGARRDEVMARTLPTP